MSKIFVFSILTLFGFTQLMAQDDMLEGYLPLVREGVRWVNEKVIVNHGDTTSYYYSYEIDGPFEYENYDSDGFMACHYHDYSGYNDGQDSIISGLAQWGWDVACWLNEALIKTKLEGRNLLKVEYLMSMKPAETYLYNFFHGQEELFLEFYFNQQVEPFLTEDNFIAVDPIDIEGYTCSRYAYLGEDGEPLAYVVEGIGFDSRDLGDLLTPFTRKPDPDADYQEWCGLCHVVKDGKVIYKGMRYTPDNMTGIDEVVADKGQRAYDGTYYNLMGQPVGKEVPTTPGIYIHNGNKILVR